MHNDDKKTPHQLQHSLNMEIIKANKGPLLKFIGGFWIIFFLFSTAFLGIGAFAIGKAQQSFFDTAIESQATVTDIGIDSYIETTTDSNNRKIQTEKKRTILYITYPVRDDHVSTKVDDMHPTAYKTGDSIEIAYNPNSPKNVKKLSDKDNISNLFFISKLLLGIFLAISSILLISKIRTTRPRHVNKL